MPRMKVYARDLKPMDLCLGSRTLILSTPNAGVSTPSGKVDIKVQRSNAKVVYVTWSARTQIAIERPEL
jgi:hypothetical protein